MKKLYRFYCLDCDNAWLELLEELIFHAKCDYCSKEIEAENLHND